MVFNILEKSYRQQVLVRMVRGPGPPQPGPVLLPPAGERGRPGAAPAQGAHPQGWWWGQTGNARQQIKVRLTKALVMVTGLGRSLGVARPGCGEEAGPRAMVGLGQQGWWPGCSAATMEFRWGPWRSLSLTMGQRKVLGAPSEALNTARGAGSALGNWELPRWICMPQRPQINLPSVLFWDASLLLLFYFCVYMSDVQFEKEDFQLMIKHISMALSGACNSFQTHLWRVFISFSSHWDCQAILG